MVKIVKNLVKPELIKEVTYGAINKKKTIIIHETGNVKTGANAKSHGNLQANGNTREASWHYTVDEEQAVQSFNHNIACWAAGSEKGNKEGIQIEICVNIDGDFKKAVKNTAELVKLIMKEENISIENIKQHNEYSGKNCPQNLRSGAKGITFNELLNMIKETPKPVIKPIAKPITKNEPLRLKVKVDNLHFYNSPRWNNPVGTVKKGTILTINKKVKVDNSYQYELKSGTFITANEKYIELI
jgi:N-acetylmuramoyl-L-alanine amidase CwlA